MVPALRALLIAFLLASPGIGVGIETATANPLTDIPGIVREALTISIQPDGLGPFKLEAGVIRPAAAGRHPLLIWSHGTPRDPDDRAKTNPNTASHTAIAFAQRGWAVVSLVRRGYGQSDGPYAEGSGACRNPDYRIAARASRTDILEALKQLIGQSYVDPTRIMFAGISAGGFASLAAAAERPPGLVAVLNFAGGRGSDKPDSVCGESNLVDVFGEFGGKVAVPTFWAYAANDHFFRPELVQRFHEAFARAGGKAALTSLPAFGSDGHFLTSSEGMSKWRDPLDQWLRVHNLPTWPSPIMPAAGSIPAYPGWSGNALTEFDRYLASTGVDKAMAVSDRGGYAWRGNRRSPEEAAAAAVAACAEKNGICRVYAINNALAR